MDTLYTLVGTVKHPTDGFTHVTRANLPDRAAFRRAVERMRECYGETLLKVVVIADDVVIEYTFGAGNQLIEL